MTGVSLSKKTVVESAPFYGLLFLPSHNFSLPGDGPGVDMPMDYGGGRHAISLCTLSHNRCITCFKKFYLGYSERGGKTEVDSAGILAGRVNLFTLTPHKVLHIDVLRELYSGQAKRQFSAVASAGHYNDRCGQTALESVVREMSTLECRELQKDCLPDPMNNVGNNGVFAGLTGDDAQKAFMLWAGITRAKRFDEDVFSYENSSKDSRLGKYRGVVLAVLAHFALHGMFGAKGHACSDCVFKGLHGMITNAVTDGVTATCPCCGFQSCGGELDNMIRDRFCLEHYAQHDICGVMESPESNQPCGKPVSKSALGRGKTATGSSSTRGETLRRLACDVHEHVEMDWRQRPELSEEFTAKVRLRRARARLAGDKTRFSDPSSSDHCEGGGGDSNACKNAWVVASECAGTAHQQVLKYRVNFKRHFCYVYVVCMRPCGIVLNSKFFPRAESPEEWIGLQVETFPEIEDMPSLNWFDAACRVAPTIFLPSGKHRAHLARFQNTAIVVPPLHQKSHKASDWFCTNFCNAEHMPETFARGASGEREFKVNGSVVEELFSWTGGFESSVRAMQKPYAEAFYKVVLDEHNAGVVAKRKVTGKRVHDGEGRRVEAKRKSTRPLKRSKFN